MGPIPLPLTWPGLANIEGMHWDYDISGTTLIILAPASETQMLEIRISNIHNAGEMDVASVASWDMSVASESVVRVVAVDRLRNKMIYFDSDNDIQIDMYSVDFDGTDKTLIKAGVEGINVNSMNFATYSDATDEFLLSSNGDLFRLSVTGEFISSTNISQAGIGIPFGMTRSNSGEIYITNLDANHGATHAKLNLTTEVVTTFNLEIDGYPEATGIFHDSVNDTIFYINFNRFDDTHYIYLHQNDASTLLGTLTLDDASDNDVYIRHISYGD